MTGRMLQYAKICTKILFYADLSFAIAAKCHLHHVDRQADLRNILTICAGTKIANFMASPSRERERERESFFQSIGI